MNEIQNLNLIVTEVKVIRREHNPDSINISTTLPSQWGSQYKDLPLSFSIGCPPHMTEQVLTTMGLKITKLIDAR